MIHSVWTAFFDRCLIKLPACGCVSRQYGGSWTLESLSLCHPSTTIIALNRTIRDGVSYVNCLTPIPEEWLIERDWHIVNHWEDQFCRDAYQELCAFAEMQHLRATALVSPGTTPSCMSSGQHCQHTSGTTIGKRDNCEDTQPMCLEICTQARWEIESTTYNHFYCQAKIIVSGCGFTSAISKSGKTYWGLQLADDSLATKHTRVLLLPPALVATGPL